MNMKNRASDFALIMLFILIFCFTCVSTAPIVQPFHNFFVHVTSNKCDLPKNIKPFAPSARGWYFLSEPLSQCDGANVTFETQTLCAEILENFVNTTCTTIDPKSIPKISYRLSSDVCTDFANSSNIIPKIEGYVGGKLADRTVCKLACASQYEILCKVLFWSYQVRHHIEAAIGAGTENQNDVKHLDQNKIDVVQDQNDLQPSIGAKDEISPQVQSVGAPNGVSDASSIAGVENENQVLQDAKLSDEIAKNAFDDQRLLIPDFTGHDKENHDQTMSPQMKVGMVSSTTKDLPAPSLVDGNKKTNNDAVIKSNEIANEQRNDENVPLSSLRNDVIRQDIEVTVSKNQNTTSNAEDTAAKKIAKEKLKSKIKEKFKKHETAQNAVVGENNATSQAPVTNIDGDMQAATNEKLSNNRGSQLETKDPSLGKNKIDHTEKDSTSKLVPETPKDNEGGKVEHTNLSSEKAVSFTSSTTSNPVKDGQLSSASDISIITSNTKANKASDQQISQGLMDNKDITSASKTEVKSTVESQGKDVILTGESSNVPNLETTTLEITLEEMDDANELPPPVQGQDQFTPDGALPPSTENRKVIAQDFFSTTEKTSVFNDQQNDFSKLYDDFIPKNIGGQVSDDIRRLPPFPEEEDGHFFFYFLSIILILMIGYLIFHNKQKIIALIVEGRHERRRRSYGAGYKKLETK
ncbi:trans-Golgi network integral membrane protein 2-like isoform X2 [Uloborus diversus]|uniref:trans-Golgi network integral membrane protein 2-like isoform X2 n=1 Tax=Uloborus diversus TaxID=327109 RepID=UPI002409CA1E|nr:trans-Golgi network integral membrane protein 2-like isoform X2 [Uloborus diversus]